jgi:hypothetical protein
VQLRDEGRDVRAGRGHQHHPRGGGARAAAPAGAAAPTTGSAAARTATRRSAAAGTNTYRGLQKTSIYPPYYKTWSKVKSNAVTFTC